jgi:hypothetical protein
VHLTGRAEAQGDDAEELVDLRLRLHYGLGLQHVAVRVVERRALGSPCEDEDRAAILRRNELLREHPEEEHRDPDPDHREAEDGGAMIYGEAQDAVVGAGQAMKSRLEGVVEAPVADRFPEDPGAEHRRQRQGHDGRDGHGRGQGDPELPEESAGRANHECEGHEDGHERDGGGDHGEGDLAHPVEGGLLRRLPGLDPPVDVLQHHDGVVHHEADGQGEAEQGDDVDGVAEGVKDCEGADHGDGDRDGGNQGSPEGA